MKEKKIVLLFAGKAGAGKNTSADLVENVYSGSAIRTAQFSFAGSLNAIAKEMGWDGKKDEKGRRLLQQIGAAGRAYDKDVWAKCCLSAIQESDCDIAMITDLRFPNEARVIKEAFPEAELIKVFGRGYDLGDNGDDPSEHGFDDVPETYWSYQLDNSGTLKDLDNNVFAMLKEII